MVTRSSVAGVVLLALVLSAAVGLQEAPAPAPAQPADPSAASPAPTEPTEPTARELLAAMAKAYAECSSDRDAGTVTTTFIGRDQTERLAFKTAFVRGGSFRFEYSKLNGHSAGKPYIVWTDGNVIRSWWHVNPGGVEKHFFLSMALAGATGVSGGSAHTLPRLLMPDRVGGWALTDAREPERAGEETIDGRVCLKIVAQHPGGGPLTIWIDKQTHLVCQIFESHELKDKDLKWEETTTYKPELDPTIDAAELAFNPPADGAEPPEK